MPIRDHPFTDLGDGQPRPMLWVRVINPHTNNRHPPVLALLDTGADECSFPAGAAFILGHDLTSVPRKEITTAGGRTWAHPHTSRVEILEIQPDGRPGVKVLYTIPDTLIDFTIGLKCFILGTRNFLCNFMLKIDYPRQTFSIRFPTPPQRKKKAKSRRR